MCLILELTMLVLGVFALINGAVGLGSSWTRGVPARIAGAIMIAPLPVSLFLLAVTNDSLGAEFTPSHFHAVAIIEMILVVTCYLTAVTIIGANAVRAVPGSLSSDYQHPDGGKKKKKKKKRRDRDDDFDDYDDYDRPRRRDDDYDDRPRRGRDDRDDDRRRDRDDRYADDRRRDRDDYDDRRRSRDDDDDRRRDRDDDYDDRPPRRRDDDDYDDRRRRRDDY
jgi:hypothetical protein